MIDGTVEWFSLRDALTKKDFTAEGKIQNVSNIRLITNVGTGLTVENAGGGYMTTIAIREDGKFYDLLEIIGFES